jgi:hypothetical protein
MKIAFTGNIDFGLSFARHLRDLGYDAHLLLLKRIRALFASALKLYNYDHWNISDNVIWFGSPTKKN